MRAHWALVHPYGMLPNFTGREDERAVLSKWLYADPNHPLLVVLALGGFGKSALTWHWLKNDVDPSAWPRVVWWSFYEEPDFSKFVSHVLEYLNLKVVSQLGARQQVDALVHALQQPDTLLILDGFERTLRAFPGLNAAYQGDEAKETQGNDRDCISMYAEIFLKSICSLPGMRGKVLMTTRLRPNVVQAHGGALLDGCVEEPLRELHPADAAKLFHAEHITGSDVEIKAACKPYGYHPLSLRLLAGLIVHDLQQPGDIAAAKRLDVSGDLVQRQHHVLEQAYNSLSPSRQKLLSSIACFRGPVSYEVLEAIAEQDIDADLRDLVTRGLLHHDRKENRFDVHPIVRRYAYERLTASDRTAAHTRLRDYFAAVPMPDKVACLEDLAPVIELYHHTVRAGHYEEAVMLFHSRLSGLYYQLGAYQLLIDLLHELLPDGEDRPPRLKNESAQGWTLSTLAIASGLVGQPRRAVPLLERANAIAEKQGDASNLAIGLGNVATQQLAIGAVQASEANVRRRIVLSREIKNKFDEAIGHRELGRLLACRGAYAESETELATALETFVKQAKVQGQGITWTYHALLERLQHRSTAHTANHDSQSAISPARRALELADEDARTTSPVERDYVTAHWALGASHRIAGQHDEAERYLSEALERCRRINLVETEADILIDLVRLRAATGAAGEAQRLAEEATVITERSGYVLQGADAHLELAKLALARADKKTAKEHAQKAKDLATCDGPPDYTYKAAYDEARALLATL